jgi:hypothetical protein
VIVVRIELWPFGDSRRLMALDELTIVNVGTLEGSRCRYEVRLGDEVAILVHDRGDGAAALAAAALAVLLPPVNSRGVGRPMRPARRNVTEPTEETVGLGSAR